MVCINEWLPNPIGPDAKGEFVELWNNGSAPVDLRGWVLRADGKKKFKLSGIIHANEYLILLRRETKLSLKNVDGELILSDAAEKQVDRSAFDGSAPEGESFNRANYNTYNGSGPYDIVQRFVWGKPTPGGKNSVVAEIGISDIQYPVHVPVNTYHPNSISVIGLAALAGVIFAAVLWYAMKKDENISQFFFRRDEESWL